MDFFEKLGVTAVLGMIAIFVAAVYGWVMNIVALAGSSFDPLTGLVVIRCFGVFIPPLGAVLGYV